MKLREKIMSVLRKNGYKRTYKVNAPFSCGVTYFYIKRVNNTDISVKIINYLSGNYNVKLNFLSPGKNYNIEWVNEPKILEEAVSILNTMNEVIENETER